MSFICCLFSLRTMRSLPYCFNTIYATLWRRQWHPTPVLLPGKSRGWRNLVGFCPWGRSESDTSERPHFHFPLSCIGEGNVNPLQCSCRENPRDRGAWWAAISGIAQSRTRLKRLSSSSSNKFPDDAASPGATLGEPLSRFIACPPRGGSPHSVSCKRSSRL